MRLVATKRLRGAWWPGPESNWGHADFQSDEDPLTNDAQREPTPSGQQVPAISSILDTPLFLLGRCWSGASQGQAESAVRAPASVLRGKEPVDLHEPVADDDERLLPDLATAALDHHEAIAPGVVVPAADLRPAKAVLE